MPMLECPTCGKQISYRNGKEAPFRPFCSRRCKLIDLGKWLNEEYRLSEECPAGETGPPPAVGPPDRTGLISPEPKESP